MSFQQTLAMNSQQLQTAQYIEFSNEHVNTLHKKLWEAHETEDLAVARTKLATARDALTKVALLHKNEFGTKVKQKPEKLSDENAPDDSITNGLCTLNTAIKRWRPIRTKILQDKNICANGYILNFCFSSVLSALAGLYAFQCQSKKAYALLAGVVGISYYFLKNNYADCNRFTNFNKLHEKNQDMYDDTEQIIEGMHVIEKFGRSASWEKIGNPYKLNNFRPLAAHVDYLQLIIENESENPKLITRFINAGGNISGLIRNRQSPFEYALNQNKFDYAMLLLPHTTTISSDTDDKLENCLHKIMRNATRLDLTAEKLNTLLQNNLVTAKCLFWFRSNAEPSQNPFEIAVENFCSASDKEFKRMEDILHKVVDCAFANDKVNQNGCCQDQSKGVRDNTMKLLADQHKKYPESVTKILDKMFINETEKTIYLASQASGIDTIDD